MILVNKCIIIGLVNRKGVVTMRICPECSSQLPQDSQFCSFCGKRLLPISHYSYSHKWHFVYVIIPVSFTCLISFIFRELDVRIVELIGCTLSALLLIMDVKELKRNGFVPGGWIFLGLIFAPLYLLVRAIKTRYWWGFFSGVLLSFLMLLIDMII